MRKRMEQLASQLDPSVMYFTEDPPFMDGDDSYFGCKYFLLWTGTNKIFAAYKTQQEMIDQLEFLSREKFVVASNGFAAGGFKVMK